MYVRIISCLCVVQRKRESRLAAASGCSESIDRTDRIVLKDLRKKLDIALSGRTRADELLVKAKSDVIKLRTDAILLQARLDSLTTEFGALKVRHASDAEETKERIADKREEMKSLRSSYSMSQTHTQQKIEDLMALLRLRDSTIASHNFANGNSMTSHSPGSVYHFTFGGNAVTGGAPTSL